MAYWDTSCLVKLYAPEADSADFKAHVVAGASVVTSDIARLEFWTTVRRKEAAGDLIPDGARQALRAFDADVAAGLITIKAMDSAVVAKFETIVDQFHGTSPLIALRTLDAIHLATALTSAAAQVVATDARLRDAAIRMALGVYPPP